MAINQSPPTPRAALGDIVDDPITHQKVVMIRHPWAIYLRDTRNAADSTPQLTEKPIELRDQNDAISATTMTTPEQDGIYSFEYYLTKRVADGVSSSAQIAIDWTQNGVKSHTFTALTIDTTSANASERYLFRADANGPIRYSVNYASNTPNGMHYDADLVLSGVAPVETS